MHIIRTSSMMGSRICALFVVSTYISRVIDENVRKIAKTKENKKCKENKNVLFDLYNNIHKYKNRNKGNSNLGISLPEILWWMVLFIVAYKLRIGVCYESFCPHLKLPLVSDLAMNTVLCCLPSVCSVNICDIVDII